MSDLLAAIYPWTKSLHVMAVLTWMAGLFYLPRLFVYHAERGLGAGEPGASLVIMERKLFKLIMNPSLIAVWLFGLLLVFTPGIVDWGMVWPWTKGASILAMTWFHHWLGLRLKDFAAGANTRSGRDYRIMNEVPTILMIVIVLSVIVKF
ncbi:MAG: CopD family protein [Rhodobacterales bacterium]|nr:CopD family protein [Rhodobacterales bacterium]